MSTVELKTSKGTIQIALDTEKAPVTTENFLNYVRSSFFDGLIFHRVIPGFMIQGGGMTPDMEQKQTQPPITNEADNGLPNKRGSIAMARTSDPHSATAQFFINVKDNDFLNYQGPENPGYAVFGEVTDGMDVVDDIVSVPTHTVGHHEDVPEEPVLIESSQVLK